LFYCYITSILSNKYQIKKISNTIENANSKLKKILDLGLCCFEFVCYLVLVFCNLIKNYDNF